MHEASWVRSVYLYLMCLVSIALVGFGAIAFVTGAVHTIAPDLGHRDTLDRVGIGIANIATNVVDVIDEAQGGDTEEFCRDVTDNDEDFQDCLGDQELSGDPMSAIEDGIGEVRSELRNQIRNNSIDHMLRGLMLVGAGVLLFRIHGRRTELFADGLIPKAPTPEPGPEGVGPPPALVDYAPVPPPPPASPGPGTPPPA